MPPSAKPRRKWNRPTRSMGEVSASGEETFRIVKTIDVIAFQTHLLALNAAVKAARAWNPDRQRTAGGAGQATGLGGEVPNAGVRSAIPVDLRPEKPADGRRTRACWVR